MTVRLNCLIALLSVLLPAWGAAARADSRECVEQDLKARKAAGYTIGAITEDYVKDTFPQFDFFAVRFRQYPVAILPPKGLSSSNVAVVVPPEEEGDECSVFYLTNHDDLTAFFLLYTDRLDPTAEGADAKDAARTWLRLSQELYQDGFFSFSKPSVDFTEGKAEDYATGTVTVTGGGKGEISVVLTFDSEGYLTDVEEQSTVKPGVRPICQATKLLDADPLVRRMAERDLLVMGRDAKPYLDEQRAKARQELREAIDRVWRRIVDEGW